MKFINYFFNCSVEYIDAIDPDLYNEISKIIGLLPKRQTQSGINSDLFLLLTDKQWSYDTIPIGTDKRVPDKFNPHLSIDKIKRNNNRKLCLTSTTIDARWHSDFAKQFGSKLVQIEAQFGKVEAMFKDFCGFKIAYAERRLWLGIEIVLKEPSIYFAHRRNAVGGMASFEIAKKTLATIGLNCPIWVIAITEQDET